MNRTVAALLAVLLGILVAGACARGEGAFEEAPPEGDRAVGESAGYGLPAPARSAPAAPPIPTPAPPSPQVTLPRPALPEETVGRYGIVEKPVVEVETAEAPSPGMAPPAPEDAFLPELASLVTQRRIIVRTAQVTLVVDDVGRAIDDIGDMAQEMGGWVVSTDLSGKDRGTIAVRVPAERLEEALDRLRRMALEVEAEVTNSQDVTDEYVDLQARLKNFQATEAALIRLLEQAQDVEGALAVQKELTRVQEEIERVKGRIKFLEETSAFSLITVTLKLKPQPMTVDAGADRTAAVGQVVRFRATFRPPEGVEDFFWTWDFGDGTPQVTGSRVAPTLEEGVLVTSTVSHAYTSEEDSPYIVKVEIRGTGSPGLVEGEDTLIINVFRQPVIEVFAGESRSVEEGQEVRFEASFTRPKELRDLEYEWDFGDGSEAATGTISEGQTTLEVTHVYENARPRPYTATLTIRGQGPAGEVEASDSVAIFVREAPGWVVAGWDMGGVGRDAVRALTAIARGLVVALIWAAILSPLWLAALAVGLVVVRRARHRRAAGAQGGD